MWEEDTKPPKHVIERYSGDFWAKVNQSGVRNVDRWKPGDIIDLSGQPKFSRKNFIIVEDIKHRSSDRHRRMFLFPVVGLLVISTVLVKDRNRLLELISLG